MAEVANEKAEKDGPPHDDIRCSSEHKSFVDSKEEIQVPKLRQYNRCACRDRRSGRGGVSEPEVGLLVEEGKICANERRDGFDKEEKESVEKRK